MNEYQKIQLINELFLLSFKKHIMHFQNVKQLP